MSMWRTNVTIEHSILGGIGTNTWQGRLEDPFTEELQDMSDWIQLFYESLNTVLATSTLISHDGQWNEINTEDPTLSFTDGFTVGITGASGVLPPSQCLVVGWATSSPTKGGRGRTFVGPLKLDTLEGDGTPNASHIATVKAAADALIESSDSLANGALGVYSTDPSGAPPAPVFRDFVSAKVANRFSVLRSRRD